MIVVLDTNWLISYLISKETNSLKLILLNTSIDIAYSEELITEFIRKIYIPKFRKYFLIEDALEFIKNFAKRGELFIVKTPISICRDAKDNFLLALSREATADYLITGDGDLLILKKFESTVICTLPVFLEKYLNT